MSRVINSSGRCPLRVVCCSQDSLKHKQNNPKSLSSFPLFSPSYLFPLLSVFSLSSFTELGKPTLEAADRFLKARFCKILKLFLPSFSLVLIFCIAVRSSPFLLLTELRKPTLQAAYCMSSRRDSVPLSIHRHALQLFAFTV